MKQMRTKEGKAVKEKKKEEEWDRERGRERLNRRMELLCVIDTRRPLNRVNESTCSDKREEVITHKHLSK